MNILNPKIRYEAKVLRESHTKPTGPIGIGHNYYTFRVKVFTWKFAWRRFRFEEHVISREVIGFDKFHWADTGFDIYRHSELVLRLKAAINLYQDQKDRETL